MQRIGRLLNTPHFPFTFYIYDFAFYIPFGGQPPRSPALLIINPSLLIFH